ncbi:hypothetical protein [Persicirhabdus sediminis]|uniref:Uncharacterized protein n=1 Tax=Persicirhabdus sediminis TaxID=454144 RepID=A0A8J7MIJ9_9BACT|nr:hypothetical protein [Persicirhabdus sediminis]MBK1792649.1 hypothetical protein [Persicirhabdus sediminis]
MKSSALILLATCLPLAAQVYNPTGATPQQQPANNSSSGDTTIVRQPKEKAASPIGNEIPFLDPNQESITFGGMTFPLLESRLGSQYQSYLAAEPNLSDEATGYRQAIEDILAATSPQRSAPMSQKLREGFRLLPLAASYPGDAKICDSLGNAIYTAMLSKMNSRQLKDMMEDMEKEKSRLIRNADITAEGNKLQQAQPTSSKKGGKQNNSKSVITSRELRNYDKRILELEAMQKANRVKGEAAIISAKVQYQGLLTQLFLQRRFEHVVMGCRFYNLIFGDGDNKLRIKKGSDVDKFFSEGMGTVATVAGLDSAANEAIRKSDSLVEAFNNHISHKELHNGSRRLMEAFAIGEFMASVQTVPAEQRRIILEYVQDSFSLVKAMDVHDYSQAQIIVQSLKEQSSDFDSTAVDGAIAAYTRVANSHVRAAKMALLQQDMAKFETELKNATEVWPTNPKLNELDELLDRGASQLDTAGTLVNDFDRLLADKNYREIFNRRYEFVPAVKDDIQRRDAIEQIITNIMVIEQGLKRAESYSQKGLDYEAWESLRQLRDKPEFSKDAELGRAIEQLASNTAELARALTRAQELEEGRFGKPQVGSAMSWYLEAQRIYPGSQYAKDGINRLLDIMLPESSK